MAAEGIASILLQNLTEAQSDAVRSSRRRVLIVAGAGSGKTEVMARRIGWWVGVEGVPKDKIVAFTFTDRAAEEMKFRIRHWLQQITPAGEEVALGGMYVGTIHGFCLEKIREYWPDEYHNYDILNEMSRAALIARGFNGLLALRALGQELGQGQYATTEQFTRAYDQLHEHNCFDVRLTSEDPPHELGAAERDWCKQAELLTDVGDTSDATAFGRSAARYYAYLRCRRFLDFSTSQGELIRRLEKDTERTASFQGNHTHLVVDEVQDINPVQRQLMDLLVGATGNLTAVGDHRQSIYGFRGAKVSIIASLWEGFRGAEDAEVVDLTDNFRSTPRIIDLANRWASSIGTVRSMRTEPMRHGNKRREDRHRSHVALVSFADRPAEAEWIAEAIRVLVPNVSEGALHDKRDGTHRGLALSDIALLVRSSTDVRTYMQTLEASGIPCVVRAGPDLFSQPEVLFFIAALAISAGHEEFYGSQYNPKSIPVRVQRVLGSGPRVLSVLHAAAAAIRGKGLPLDKSIEERVQVAAEAIRERIAGNSIPEKVRAPMRSAGLRAFLASGAKLRRVFPQKLYHMLLEEAEAEAWDTCEGRGQAAFYHLGALSGLITGLETPGWTSAGDYPWQIIGLCQFGAQEGRAEEQPLMVQPEAVSISTVHGAKGLEFAAVFLADVNPQRFPSNFARRAADLPLSGPIVKRIDVASLSDNANYDGERRLMYVAMTRAERFLFISHSGARTSRFIRELDPMVAQCGGLVTDKSKELLEELRYAPKEHERDLRLATSFSDLRYYLECPHDFYLRKVLGFAPTIDQAFGYGRAVHNVMRAIHSEPTKWAALAGDRGRLEGEIQGLVDRGLFYLRYTTGEPADNMRQKGVRIVADYVQRYREELASMEFVPEKEFETLVEYEDGSGGGALISGAIDIIRQDDPPRITLIDFKSGDPTSDGHQKLDEKEMQLQVAVYAIAAKRELEYEPDKGLVRYLDADDKAKGELQVPLDSSSLDAAKRTVAQTAAKIRERQFKVGPVVLIDGKHRCESCDFLGLCGMEEAKQIKGRGN